MKDHITAKQRLANLDIPTPHFRLLIKRIRSWLSPRK